jgi:hypothetical protein
MKTSYKKGPRSSWARIQMGNPSTDMLSQVGRIVTTFLGGCILFTAMLADGQSNLVLLISAVGDSIGAGQTYYTTNQSNIVVSGTGEAMTIQAFGFTMILAGPGQSPLTVGQYSNAVEYPSNGTAPGLSVFGNGQTCTNVCGYFQIYEFQPLRQTY